MKKKISIKIFAILMIAFIVILGISMKLNIDAQINLYSVIVRQQYNYGEKFDEIRKVFPFTRVENEKELMEKLAVEEKSEEYKKKLRSLADKTYNFMFSIMRNDEDSTSWTQGYSYENFGQDDFKIHGYSFGDEMEDNFICLQGINDDNNDAIYSIEKLSEDEKISLLTYIETSNKDDEGYKNVRYCLQDNELVFLQLGNNQYGHKNENVKDGFVTRYSINGQHVYYDFLRSEFRSFNIEEMKNVVRNEIHSFAGGDDNYASDVIKYGNTTYFVMSVSRYSVVEHSDALLVVNVVEDIEGYVMQVYLEDNLWLYIGAFIVAIITSWIFSYMIAKPIRKIEKAALQISNQDFENPLIMKSKDEIGSLAKSIDSMRIQLKETIENLKTEIEKVKELESLRKDFVNQFTHEMKTPLGIINGYSELIEEAENQEEVDKYLDIINRETTKINELIQSMLKLSRLEAGKVELNKELFDLEESVVHIVDDYEILLMKKNIKVEVLNKNSEIIADKKLIETVIHNFLSNAIKHTLDNHRIIITIDKGVAIYNEGDAIKEDHIDHIWHTFVTHDQKGSGLGLAISRSILELHQFSYGVENQDNGVCFYFNINHKSLVQ